MKVTAAPPEISNNVTWMNVDGTSSGRVALATTGNVGIGNAAPTAKLDIVDATNMPATPAVNSIVPFKISNGTSEAILIDSNQIESVGGWLNLNFRPTTQNTTIAVGGGNVGIGTSGPLEKLSVDWGHMLVRSAFPTLYMMDTDHRSSAIHTNSNFLYFLTSPVDSRSYAPVANSAWPLILNLTNNDASFWGNVWAYGFYYISDKNLKKDIKKIESPLEKILKLNGYTFNWKDSGKADIGVIAQEVEQVFPELVAENKNAKWESYKTVQYGNLVAPIIEAIKELASQVKSLHALIEEQQSDIRKLKSENAELKARLDAIEARLAQ